MILSDKILIGIFNGTNYSGDLVNQIVDNSSNGEDVCELEWQLILLGQWIRVLQDFYDNNFTEQGEVIVPAFHTITLVQAEKLCAKINVAIGSNKYPITMFNLGIWSDDQQLYFDDGGVWYDELPLT